MGYDLHITRKANWCDDDGPAIGEAEWRAVIDADPELALDTETRTTMKDGEYVYASWNGEPGALGFYGGEVTAKNPPEPLIRKMVEVAGRLGGSVQGDDGERYPDALDVVPPRRGRAAGCLRWAAVVAVVGVGVFWLLFFANRPARETARLAFTPPGGTPVVLTLWTAEPLVPLPFTDDTSWVRCGPSWWRLHGRGFEEGVGPLAVSPDGREVVAFRAFAGSSSPVVRIDLAGGRMRRADGVDYEARGWAMRPWVEP